MWPYGEPFSGHLMHDDAVRRLLQGGCAKNMHESIDEILYAGRTINVQVSRAGIASRPGACMQKRHQVRNMVWMEMRYDDVLHLVVLNTGFKQPFNYAMPAVSMLPCSRILHKDAKYVFRITKRVTW